MQQKTSTSSVKWLLILFEVIKPVKHPLREEENQPDGIMTTLNHCCKSSCGSPVAPPPFFYFINLMLSVVLSFRVKGFKCFFQIQYYSLCKVKYNFCERKEGMQLMT